MIKKNKYCKWDCESNNYFHFQFQFRYYDFNCKSNLDGEFFSDEIKQIIKAQGPVNQSIEVLTGVDFIDNYKGLEN